MLPSPDAPFSLAALWHALFWPMLRLLLGLAVGLLIANLLEALRWTRYLARLAAPLARTAHLREVAGAWLLCPRRRPTAFCPTATARVKFRAAS